MDNNQNIMAAVNAAYEGKVKSVSELRVYDPNHMELLVNNLEEEVHCVAIGLIYEKDKYQYALALIRNSRVLEGDENFRYWSPADMIEHIPEDAKAKLLFLPTYLAAAALLKIYDDCSDEEKQVLYEPLSQTMHACCGWQFCDHGLYADDDLLDAMQECSDYSAAEIIKKYPEICGEFTKQYKPYIDNL